jgi:hypothetical protein
MVHRYLATGVGFLILVLAIAAWRAHRQARGGQGGPVPHPAWAAATAQRPCRRHRVRCRRRLPRQCVAGHPCTVACHRCPRPYAAGVCQSPPAEAAWRSWCRGRRHSRGPASAAPQTTRPRSPPHRRRVRACAPRAGAHRVRAGVRQGESGRAE